MTLRFVLRSRPLKPTSIRLWYLDGSKRTFASIVLPIQNETISLKVGGNGFVNLKITRPIAATTSSKILVRFPRGPSPDHSEVKELQTANTQDLSNHIPDTTIVDLEYRLRPRTNDAQSEPDYRFPTPIHDVFTAWDYILNEIASSDYRLPEPKICLQGSHIGGAQALTLALTNPNQVHAVALEDPFVDWVILDELAAYSSDNAPETEGAKRRSTRRGGRESVAAVARGLIKLRTQLFRTPSGYFDAFASPTLFLRAPGRDTPLTKTAAPIDPEADYDEVIVEGAKIRYGEEDDEVGIVEYDGRDEDFGPYDDDWHAIETKRIRDVEYRHATPSSESASPSQSSQSSTKDESEGYSSDGTESSPDTLEAASPAELPRRRKVLLRWPPTAQPEDVVLPHVNIFLSKPSSNKKVSHKQENQTSITPVTWLQGRELAELLKRACFWGRDPGFANERVTLSERDPALNHVPQQEEVMRWLLSRFEDK